METSGKEDSDYKFVSKIKCDEHLIRTHNQPITVLSNEVIEHILDFLHPNDLVELIRRCDHYKNIFNENVNADGFESPAKMDNQILI